jgi:hypothetical protein
MGGAYRLASVAIDLDVDELARRTRRVSDRLRWWRRSSRPRRGIAVGVEFHQRQQAAPPQARIKPPTYPAAARRCPAAG